jgi:hypothetical protein
MDNDLLDGQEHNSNGTIFHQSTTNLSSLGASVDSTIMRLFGNRKAKADKFSDW